MTPVLDELQAAWSRTDQLFEIVGDTWFDRSLPLRHPPVFYLGHLPAFSRNQVLRGVLGRPSWNPEFDDLFERGIDPLNEAEAERVAIREWPDLPEVIAYRDRVREEVLDAAAEIERRSGDDVMAQGQRIYHLVLEHEVMHHETLVYLLQEIDHESKVRPQDAPALRTGDTPAPERREITPGRVTLGADFDAVPFGWDNEFPRQEVQVEGFSIDRYPVTIESFRAFVDAGAYDDARWWEPEHFEWIQAQDRRAPHHWRERDGEWVRRGMFEDVSLDAVGGWPVIVSGAEALAFAKWKGARLATEPEIRRAAYGEPDSDRERAFPWGDQAPTQEHGNFGFGHYDPLPVGSRPAGASAFGVEELVGNGWEWTGSDFAPLPGFEAYLRTYPFYSTDFFGPKHAVVFGAAWPTDTRLLRRSFRNWFQRRYPFVPATFRLVYDT